MADNIEWNTDLSALPEALADADTFLYRDATLGTWHVITRAQLVASIKLALSLAIGDVSGLQAALDAKSATGHAHVIADTTGLQAALDAKAATSAIPATVSQAEAEAGTLTSTRLWTPQRVKQAIDALAASGASFPAGKSAGRVLKVDTDGTTLIWGSDLTSAGGSSVAYEEPASTSQTDVRAAINDTKNAAGKRLMLRKDPHTLIDAFADVAGNTVYNHVIHGTDRAETILNAPGSQTGGAIFDLLGIKIKWFDVGHFRMDGQNQALDALIRLDDGTSGVDYPADFTLWRSITLQNAPVGLLIPESITASRIIDLCTFNNDVAIKADVNEISDTWLITPRIEGDGTPTKVMHGIFGEGGKDAGAKENTTLNVFGGKWERYNGFSMKYDFWHGARYLHMDYYGTLLLKPSVNRVLIDGAGGLELTVPWDEGWGNKITNSHALTNGANVHYVERDRFKPSDGLVQNGDLDEFDAFGTTVDSATAPQVRLETGPEFAYRNGLMRFYVKINTDSSTYRDYAFTINGAGGQDQGSGKWYVLDLAHKGDARVQIIGPGAEVLLDTDPAGTVGANGVKRSAALKQARAENIGNVTAEYLSFYAPTNGTYYVRLYGADGTSPGYGRFDVYHNWLQNPCFDDFTGSAPDGPWTIVNGTASKNTSTKLLGSGALEVSWALNADCRIYYDNQNVFPTTWHNWKLGMRYRWKTVSQNANARFGVGTSMNSRNMARNVLPMGPANEWLYHGVQFTYARDKVFADGNQYSVQGKPHLMDISGSHDAGAIIIDHAYLIKMDLDPYAKGQN